MSNSIYRIFDNCLPIAQWLLSSVCLLCGGRGDLDGLCKGCRNSLPRLAGMRCPVCAIPEPTGELCGRCLDRPPHFDRVVAPFMYEFPVTVLIQGLKYRGNLACARPLASGLAKTLDEEPYPDLIIPMPLTRARLAGRGFNQAMEISRRVGGGLWAGYFRRHLPPDARKRPASDPAMEATRDKCTQCLCV